MEEEGWFKERVLYRKNSGETDVRLKIDYDAFVKGNGDIKKLLLVANVIYSIRRLSEKIKTGFESKKLEDDILNLFNYKKENLA